MATQGRASKHFLKCVAIMLINVCVVILHVCPQVSSMMVEAKHIREKREALNTTARTTDSTTTNPMTTDSTTSSPTTTYSTTTDSTTTDSTTSSPRTRNSITTDSTTSSPTTSNPTTSDSTTSSPTTSNPTTSDSTTSSSTTTDSTTSSPTTSNPTTSDSTTSSPTTSNPTTSDSTTSSSTTTDSTTSNPTATDSTTTTSATTNPTTSDSTTSNPTTSDSTTSNPTTTSSATSDFITTNPSITASTTITPTITNPTTINPTTTDSTTTHLTTTDSTITDSTTTNPTTTDSPTTNSTTTNPTTTNPTTTNPTTTDSTTTDSTNVDSTTTDSTTTNSITTNPTASDPPTTNSTTTNPTTTDSTTITPTITNSLTTKLTTTDSTTSNPTTTTTKLTIPNSANKEFMNINDTTAKSTTSTTKADPIIMSANRVVPFPVLPTEYFVEIEIDTIDIATFNLVKKILQEPSFPIIKKNTIITEIHITTVCTLNGDEYQCRCEDQYSWPYEKCAQYGSCDYITDDLCLCIGAIPDDGHFCQPISELDITEYSVNIEIDTVNMAELILLRSIFETSSLPVINSNSLITGISVTTVCDSIGTGYQCRCEDQYSWPYEKCAQYGSCDYITNDLCQCIGAIPDDGHFCQPICELDITEYLVNIEIDTVNMAELILLRSIFETSSLPVINSNSLITGISVNTVCDSNGTGYQCRCEDQYSWPYEKCAQYGSCDHITNDLCQCIGAIPDDGHFCQPISELDITEYLVNIEIDTVNMAELNLLKTVLETSSLPIINSNSLITGINISTVCRLNGPGYQCRCEDQYYWPYDKCIVHGSCDCNTNSSCGCINAIPDDGPFCQTIGESTELMTTMAAATTCSTIAPNTTTDVVSFALKINEVFDFALTNKHDQKYSGYTRQIQYSINKGYSSVSAYKMDSAIVSGFRSGSVIADFDINATSDNLELLTANNLLIASLREQGFNVSDDAVSRTVKDGLYTSTNLIYPEKNLTLNCSVANDNIAWMKNGEKIVTTTKYLIEKTVLVVLNADSTDSGIYECKTSFNSMPFIVWQSIVIPYVQVNSSKEVNCRNLNVTLQCCGHPSYKVKWSEGCSNIVEEAKGCIYCKYSINENECKDGKLSTTVTCTLAGSNYSKNITIDAVNKAFTCYDNGSNAAFGAGAEGQNKTGDCNGDMIGYQIAQCKASGNWFVTYDNCIIQVIKHLEDISQTLSVIDLPQFALNLSTTVVANAADITKSPATIMTIVRLLQTIAKLSQSINVTEAIMTDVLETLDVIGSDSAKDAWLLLNKNSTTMKTCSQLLKSIEDIAHRLQDKGFNITTNYTSLNKDPNITTPFNKTFGKNFTTQIYIPATSGKKSVAVIISSVLNNILPVRNLIFNDSSETETSINGDVAVLAIDPTINDIALTFTIKNKTLGNPQCVFWNFTLLNDVGGWDTTGCQLKTLGNEPDRYTCECNHTTSFSILMSPFTPDPILDYITYIGIAISLASLVVCLIIEFIVWKSVTRNDTSYMRHVSIVNIAISLLIANICFIIGAAVVKQGEGPCSTATFFMHFFYLALFFWMLLSALLLLYRILMVFSRASKTTMRAIAFTVGYGAPLLIAVITVASTAGNHGYIQKKYNCWLNWNETRALLAFVFPALTIVVINLLVLIVVLCKMIRRGVNASIQPDDKHPLMVIAKCVAILTPLFGLTWGFGIGTMVSPNRGIHIVFAFFNSLQGFFILMFGTLLDKKVREALAGKLALANISSNRTRSTNDGPSSLGGFPFIHMLRKRDAHNISEGRVMAR